MIALLKYLDHIYVVQEKDNKHNKENQVEIATASKRA